MRSIIYVMRHANEDAIYYWNNGNKDILLSAIRQQDRSLLDYLTEDKNLGTRRNPINRALNAIKNTAQELWNESEAIHPLSSLKKQYAELSDSSNKYNVAIVSSEIERAKITAEALEEILKENKNKTKLITDKRANCDTYKLHEIVAEYQTNNLANNVIIISHEPDIKKLCGFSKFGNLNYVSPD